MDDTVDVCRLCGLADQITLNIFEPGSEHRHFIHTLLPIWVSESDNLSQKVCYRCAFKLEEFYTFRERCIATDMVLKKRRAYKEIGSPKCYEEKCVEKELKNCNSPPSEELETTTKSEISDAPTIEIITLNSRSPSPASDSTSPSTTIREPSSHCNNSAVEEEDTTESQNYKRQKTEEKVVLLHIPDENAKVNGNETKVVDANGYSFSVNTPKNKSNLATKNPVKHSDNNLSCTALTAETGHVMKSSIKPFNESVTELSKIHKTKDISNEKESVKQIQDKCNVISCKNDNSKETKSVSEGIIVTKIPGLYNVYTCSYCERTFVTKESADAHDCNVQPVKYDNLNKYECEICCREFSRHATLLSHTKRHICDSSDEDF